MLVIALAGSPSLKSRSGVLLDQARHWLAKHGIEVRSYGIRDFVAEDLLHARFDSPAVKRLVADIEAASAIVIATPVYKASISGALKTLLDLLPERALEGKVVLPLATGGSLGHMLAVDYSLKPILSALKAEDVLHSVFAEDRQVSYDETLPRLDSNLEGRLDEALHKLLQRISAKAAIRAPVPIANLAASA